MGSYGRNYNQQNAFIELAFHPNFVLPKTPKHSVAIGAYVLESAARLVSPPKYPGEDEVFTSEELADAVRYRLSDALVRRLRSFPGSAETVRQILIRVWQVIYSHNKRSDVACEDLALAIRNLTVSS